MKNFFAITFILIASPLAAYAQPLTLQDGEYMGRGDYCRVLISNDLDHQSLRYVQVGTGAARCDVEGETWEFQRISDTEFLYKNPKVEIIGQDSVLKCTPTTSAPMPCNKIFYDQNGALIFKAGDKGTHWETITLKNNDSYEFETLQMVLMRGDTVISHWDDPGSDPVMLYVKISQ